MKKYIQDLEAFFEAKQSKGNMNLVTDICTAMVLINPNFLDNILLKGQRTRYIHNTSVFVNDLKNLIFMNNKLRLGKRGKRKFVEDDDLGKVNRFFNEYSQEFDMEKDWTKLNTARDIAHTISKQILVDQQLEPSMVRTVFWLAPNKESGQKEDLVLELTDGRQFPLVINSKMNLSKTQSFNTMIDLMLDQQADKLFTDQYLERWDKLTQEWFRLVYKNATHDMKLIIDQFIDASRGDSLTYFEYFDITVQDPKFQHLGLYVPALNKNYKELSKLLSDIWKDESGIENFIEVEKEWTELKKVVLNSKIIEHLIIDSLNNLVKSEEDIVETEDNYIIANNKVKMRLMRVLINLMGVDHIDHYYCTKEEVYHVPSRQWFREKYEDITVEYDYHQRFSEDNDSQFRIKLKLRDKSLLTMELFTGFSGGEMSGKLNTKMKVQYVSDWNDKIS